MLGRLVLLLPSAFFLIPVNGEDREDRQKAPEVREMLKSNPGPWGQLEYYRIPLECPEELLQLINIPSRDVEWVIHADTQEELQGAVLRAGLTAEESAHLFSNSTILQDTGIFRIFPSAELVLSLSPATRIGLYALLSDFAENSYHRRPLFINTGNLTRWFQGSRLPRPVIEDIAKLAYATPSGRGFYLADVPLTLRRSVSALDDKTIFQGILRRQGLIVRLRLADGNLTEEIGEYWRFPSRNKAIIPLLEAVVANSGEGVLDIAHLLPEMPRQNLNRFPGYSDGISGQFPDWFWTCYNFFRIIPRDVYAHSDEANQLLHNEYEPISKPDQFGDLLVLNSEGRAVHGCIYIADDIVFTKNSPDMFSPWMLMKIEDVLGYHDVNGNVTISTFRGRPIAAPETP